MSIAASPEMMIREDWVLLRNPETCSQRAGCTLRELPAVAIKEVTDNSLDVGHCTLDYSEDGTITIEDDGPGFDGGPDGVAAMFSIRRPLSSTKIVRNFSRGAMGNGVRVAVAAVMNSGGSLVVTTRNQRIVLNPDPETGHTAVASVEEVELLGRCRCNEARGRAGRRSTCSAVDSNQLAASSTRPFRRPSMSG